MTRFSRQKAEEVQDRDSDSAKRRTVPADVGPYSPERIAKLYSKGKEYPLGKGAVTSEHQKCQFPEDKHDKDYDNDTSGWSRGGPAGGAHRPGFDCGKLDQCSKPPKPARGLEANGRDMTSSPLSAARKTYGPPPTLNKDDWG